MPYAWRPDAQSDWILIVPDVVLPGFGDPDGDGVRDNIAVPSGSAHFAGWSEEERAAAGVAALVETPRPTGCRVDGWTVADVDGQPTQVWTWSPYADADLTALRAAAVAAVKAEASARILAAFPMWKQMNLNARATELTNALAANGAYTEAEAIEALRLQAVWAWIRSVRAASDSIEAALAQASAAELEAFDAAAPAEGFGAWPAAYSGEA